MNTYAANEIFYSLEGEGVRAGTPNVFVRFTGCNLRCAKEGEAGFDCDTEFLSGRMLTLTELVDQVELAAAVASGTVKRPWVTLTGGEPGLQVDDELIAALHNRGFMVAIETNGTQKLPDGLDWITVSPKSAEHTLKQLKAHEVKYVRHYGQGIPKTVVKADHQIISPAFDGGQMDRKTLEWCIDLAKRNPPWRLSCQLHKALWGIR